MSENKIYYWGENTNDYKSDLNTKVNNIIEVKKLNFFIGKNNAGKSRFLRALFNNKFFFEDYSSPNLDEIFENKKIKIEEAFKSRELYDRHVMSKFSIKEMDMLLNIPKIYNTNYRKIAISLCERLKNVSIERRNVGDDLMSEINHAIDNFKKELPSNNSKKLYIPILRGMRPVAEQTNKQPYIERAKKDYFSEINVSDSNIITGECFYYELTVHLLGEPEQREIIKKYEEKLSQYFFDNEPITLIPKYNEDVVHIKIGEDKQFPIYQLGDGLQQAIILTYEAFIQKDEIHTFFIEEPELNMHAGMVRQVMNFYLNETKHFYFFTTHSNHLLDMADESDQVIIQKFVKQLKNNKTKFKIYRCDKDRDLLASLGVKPSSVYLANCTIWFEGITDRLYITKYMEKYLKYLEKNNSDLYTKYRRFMPNYHYAFVEYAGSNLTHWSFCDDYADSLEDKGLSAKAIASDMLLIADGDIKEKGNRVKDLNSELSKNNYHILACKETENTIPKDTIIRVAKNRCQNMREKTKQGFDIQKLNENIVNDYFNNNEFGIGKLLDEIIRNPRTMKNKTLFADGTGVGTIKMKLDFCRKVIKDFDENPGWELTETAKDVCEKIFKHIEKCNS